MEQIELINLNELAETEVLMLLREHPEYIVDRVEQTEERCITAVQQAGYLLQSIPKSIQTMKFAFRYSFYGCHGSKSQ